MSKQATYRVGDVRPSQLLWTYGPGALIDLPNLSVITMGLDFWRSDLGTVVEESRLLNVVRRVLGPQVKNLKLPPVVLDDDENPFTAEAHNGVPVRPFPRWLRCVRCGMLADCDSGLFKLKSNPYRPEQTHFVHTNCEKGKNSDAVPTRFLLACRNGHLDDFPWHWFVHSGPSTCKGRLQFFESGASLQTENLWVKCSDCGRSQSLVYAFGKDAQRNLPGCRGRHPHHDTCQCGCKEETRAIILGATNTWFPSTVSVLAIPTEKNPLEQIITGGWEALRDLASIEELTGALKFAIHNDNLKGIDKFSVAEIWDAIQAKRQGTETEIVVTDTDIKTPEWNILTAKEPLTDWPFFMSRRVEVPSHYRNQIADVLLLERLREVNALLGFTRIESPDDTVDPKDRPRTATLSKGRPDWVPVNEVHGEGIFLRFSEHAILSWAKRPSVGKRNDRLKKAHAAWRVARNLEPNQSYPGIRFVLLHTFAHLLIRELALDCGYNAASIRERIYGYREMAGVLLYTAAADSDGTLGGLVDLGKPENMNRLIGQALHRAHVCSSDPLCCEHDPLIDSSLHLASCHACTFVSETSCESGNRYLDRALLVETFECSDAAFFKVKET